MAEIETTDLYELLGAIRVMAPVESFSERYETIRKVFSDAENEQRWYRERSPFERGAIRFAAHLSRHPEWIPKRPYNERNPYLGAAIVASIATHSSILSDEVRMVAAREKLNKPLGITERNGALLEIIQAATNATLVGSSPYSKDIHAEIANRLNQIGITGVNPVIYTAFMPVSANRKAEETSEAAYYAIQD